MTRIVVYAHRPKRPPPKKLAAPMPAPVATVVVAQGAEAHKRPPKAAPPAPLKTPKPTLPTVVVATPEKRMKRLRAERRFAEPRAPSPEIEAFFARNVRPGGPLPPQRKR